MFRISLQNYLAGLPESRLKDAISYALGGTGKKLRPKLMLTLIESFGIDATPFLNAALALEMVHTYSLVHDDLPAMDDDHLRRGQPTTHVKFDEATAILVGDALLSDAFRLITDTEDLSASVQLQMVKMLSQKIGSQGMVYGQILDIASEGQAVTAEDLLAINLHKTANLLEASVLFGALAAHKTPLAPFATLARELGLLYQIQDDVLEAEGDETTLGKSFSDTLRDKPTFVTLLSKNELHSLIRTYQESIRDKMHTLHLIDTPFDTLIRHILHRTY